MSAFNRLECLSALIIQDSIFGSAGWSRRLEDIEPGFVLLRFRDGLPDLLQSSSHFELSLAIVERSLFENGPAGEGIPPRLRRCLRPIVRVSGGESPAEMERLLTLGCYGFVPDHISQASLGRVLRMVTAGQFAAPRQVLSATLHRLLNSAGAPKLTHREQEVLALLGRRLSNRRIAEQLFISAETLRWHLRNLYSKTDLNNRAELVEFASGMLYKESDRAGAENPAPEKLKAMAAAGPRH